MKDCPMRRKWVQSVHVWICRLNVYCAPCVKPLVCIVLRTILVQVQAQEGRWEKTRTLERQNGCGGQQQGSDETQARALEEKRCTGNALLLPVWIHCPHQEGLPAVQKPCRCTFFIFTLLNLTLLNPTSRVELFCQFTHFLSCIINIKYLICHLAGNVKMENLTSPSSAHLRNLREKEKQVGLYGNPLKIFQLLYTWLCLCLC